MEPGLEKAASLRERKEELEVQKLDQDLANARASARLDRWKIGIALLAALGFLGSFWLDRLKTRAESFQARRLEIVRSFGQLRSETSEYARLIRTRSGLFGLQLDWFTKNLQTLSSKLRKSTGTGDAELLASVEATLLLAKDFRDKVENASPVKELSEAMKLYSQWNHAALTPDFRLYFGASLDSHWENLREKAIGLVLEHMELDIAGPEIAVEDEEAFSKSAETFEKKLYEVINEA